MTSRNLNGSALQVLREQIVADFSVGKLNSKVSLQQLKDLTERELARENDYITIDRSFAKQYRNILPAHTIFTAIYASWIAFSNAVKCGQINKNPLAYYGKILRNTLNQAIRQANRIADREIQSAVKNGAEMDTVPAPTESDYILNLSDDDLILIAKRLQWLWKKGNTKVFSHLIGCDRILLALLDFSKSPYCRKTALTPSLRRFLDDLPKIILQVK